MAQRTIVQLEDDIDGGEATETLTFALDGVSYEIDLNEDNAAGLREAFASFVEHARRVGGGRGRRPQNPRAVRSSSPKTASEDATQVDPRAVREWAHEQGIQVSDRGRVSGAVIAQFLEAQT